MTTDINQIVATVKQATDFQANKKLLREQIQEELLFPHSGGLFKASPEIIAFVELWHDDELFLEDAYGNPIKVDKTAFLELAKMHYQQAMNSWHIQYDELKRIRKV